MIVRYDEGEFLPGDFSHPLVVRYRERILFMFEKLVNEIGVSSL